MYRRAGVTPHGPLLRRELEGIAAGVTAEEVERAKAACESSVLAALEMPSVVSEDIARQLHTYGGRMTIADFHAELAVRSTPSPMLRCALAVPRPGTAARPRRRKGARALLVHVRSMHACHAIPQASGDTRLKHTPLSPGVWAPIVVRPSRRRLSDAVCCGDAVPRLSMAWVVVQGMDVAAVKAFAEKLVSSKPSGVLVGDQAVMPKFDQISRRFSA